MWNAGQRRIIVSRHEKSCVVMRRCDEQVHRTFSKFFRCRRDFIFQLCLIIVSLFSVIQQFGEEEDTGMG